MPGTRTVCGPRGSTCPAQRQNCQRGRSAPTNCKRGRLSPTRVTHAARDGNIPPGTSCNHASWSSAPPHTSPTGTCTVWQRRNRQMKSSGAGSRAQESPRRRGTTCPRHTRDNRASVWLCPPVRSILDHMGPCLASHWGRRRSSTWESHGVSIDSCSTAANRAAMQKKLTCSARTSAALRSPLSCGL